ncbi:hypothetical protein, partial [Pseudomonas plecoglossicida]
MYFLERGFQWSKTLSTYEEDREAYEKKQRQPGQDELHAPEGVGDSVSKKVYGNDSLYSHTENFIDLRTPSDEKRGIVTTFLGWIYFFLSYATIETTSIAAEKILLGTRNNGEELRTTDYFFLIIFSLIWLILLIVFLKYTFRFFRLESFTARRIIVRFNRVTRKVYLLRPKHLGGILIMDWDKTEILLDKKMSELEGTGGFLILVWDRGDGVDLQG